MKNEALAKWQSGAFSVGAWINLPDLHIAETLARMDFDWLCFDLQHGLLSYSHLLALIPAISATRATPLVRVADAQAAGIGRALDAGAHGVIVPMVDTADQAAQAAAACRYPPLGTRSCGPMRGLLTDGMGYLASANREVACIAMIETARGLDNVEAIAATEGLSALFVGPVDLCFGLGIAPGDFGNPAFVKAITRIVAAAREAGIAAGLFGYSPESVATAKDQGFAFASAGTDIAFLRKGAADALAIARGEPARATRGGY
ncbi:MAG: aldolase/citrate lyase family protein [Sphingopyxis sp.]|uniref:HpcH/HpaI aldolase family protein n=1 Tax=Sphingopyxis sp. TaxID=1908224 RepID=UPI002AB7FA8E|nr:aldolase/citrate lyase family protein [Sphingopyxis sp.]MDZ3832611.1 aldolase/citrate lyase family protein [Sphingopyxis sp.]